MLCKNRSTLAPEFRIYLRDDILPLTETARGFSIAQDPAELGLFSYEIAEFCEALDPNDLRPIVISAEDLCGHMPGRHGIIHYEATAKLMATFADITMQAMPRPPEISFLFTTRKPVPWVQSCYAQHVRATRMTDDLATYQRAALPHANLDAIAAEIRTAVAPHPLITAALEDTAPRNFCPATALLDLMQPSAALRQSLSDTPAQNPSLLPETIEQLLTLNQSTLNDTALIAAKRALLSTTQSPKK